MRADALAPLTGEAGGAGGTAPPFLGWLGRPAILGEFLEPQSPPAASDGRRAEFAQADPGPTAGDVGLDGPP
jgi:hypothetical protein